MAVLISGDNSIFDAMVYGQGNQSGQEFLSMLNNQFMQALTPDLQAYYYNIGNTVYGGINQADAMNRLRMLGNQYMEIFQPDAILYLQTMEHFQNANAIMQRGLMANPEVRQMYHQGAIDGYAETYVDYDPNVYGNEHYDFRRATSNVWIMDSEGNYSMTDWCDYVAEGDLLSFEEQHAIQKSWDNMLGILAQRKKDPTSVWGSDIQT